MYKRENPFRGFVLIGLFGLFTIITYHANNVNSKF